MDRGNAHVSSNCWYMSHHVHVLVASLYIYIRMYDMYMYMFVYMYMYSICLYICICKYADVDVYIVTTTMIVCFFPQFIPMLVFLICLIMIELLYLVLEQSIRLDHFMVSIALCALLVLRPLCR